MAAKDDAAHAYEDEPAHYGPGELAEAVDVSGLARRVDLLAEETRTNFDRVFEKLDRLLAIVDGDPFRKPRGKK